GNLRVFRRFNLTAKSFPGDLSNTLWRLNRGQFILQAESFSRVQTARRNRRSWLNRMYYFASFICPLKTRSWRVVINSAEQHLTEFIVAKLFGILDDLEFVELRDQIICRNLKLKRNNGHTFS